MVAILNWLYWPNDQFPRCAPYSISSKCLKPIPDNMLSLCKCTGKCDKGRCSCKAGGVKCTVFCHGRNNNLLCTNKLGHWHASQVTQNSYSFTNSVILCIDLLLVITYSKMNVMNDFQDFSTYPNTVTVTFTLIVLCGV